METIAMYLIYILGIVSIVSILGFFVVKVKSMNIKSELLKDLIEHDYETENIDLQKYIK